MEHTASVEELWQHRHDMLPWFKARRLTRFFTAFEEVIRSVHRGLKFGPRRAVKTDYFDYLRGYRTRWRGRLDRRTRREVWERFRDGIDLYHSIKEEGVRDPLVLRRYRGKLCFYLGTRRLVIAHVLRIPTVRFTIWEEEQC